jgi:hypothetical protein
MRKGRKYEPCGGVVLDPWIETVGVILVALLGVFLGRVFSGLRKTYWSLGYFLPFSLVIMMVLARYNNELIFVRPFSWIVAGRMRFSDRSSLTSASQIRKNSGLYPDGWSSNLALGFTFSRSGFD